MSQPPSPKDFVKSMLKSAQQGEANMQGNLGNSGISLPPGPASVMLNFIDSLPPLPFEQQSSQQGQGGQPSSGGQPSTSTGSATTGGGGAAHGGGANEYTPQNIEGHVGTPAGANPYAQPSAGANTQTPTGVKGTQKILA